MCIRDRDCTIAQIKETEGVTEELKAKDQLAWVGDITYIPTGEGWLYCAVVKAVSYPHLSRQQTVLVRRSTPAEVPADGILLHAVLQIHLRCWVCLLYTSRCV